MSNPTGTPGPGFPVDWRWMIALGAVLLLGGLAAFAFPFMASLAVNAIAGVAFLLAGVTQAWMGWNHVREDTASRMTHGILGLVLIVLGVVLLADPLAGLVSLTLTVGLLFLLTGVLRVVVALRIRGQRGWGWALASGVLSVLLGLFVVATLPDSAGTLLGILLAVELVMSGAGAVALGLQLKDR